MCHADPPPSPPPLTVCTFKTSPVCTGTTPASVTTGGRGAGTHWNVVNAHTVFFQRATPHRTHTPRPQRHTHKTQQPPPQQHTETETETEKEDIEREEKREDERTREEKIERREERRQEERRGKRKEEN